MPPKPIPIPGVLRRPLVFGDPEQIAALQKMRLDRMEQDDLDEAEDTLQGYGMEPVRTSRLDDLAEAIDALQEGSWDGSGFIMEHLYDLRGDRTPDDVDPDTVDLVITPEEFTDIVHKTCAKIDDLEKKLKALNQD
jgi:hypothetical protein